MKHKTVELLFLEIPAINFLIFSFASSFGGDVKQVKKLKKKLYFKIAEVVKVIIKGIVWNGTARKVIFYKSIVREIFNKVRIMIEFFDTAAMKTALAFAKIVSNQYYQNRKQVSAI